MLRLLWKENIIYGFYYEKNVFHIYLKKFMNNNLIFKPIFTSIKNNTLIKLCKWEKANGRP